MITRRPTVLLTAVATAFLAVACNQKKELTRSYAVELIDGSSQFQHQQTASFTTGGLCVWQTQLTEMLAKPRPLKGIEIQAWVPIAAAARSAGWIKIDHSGVGCKDGLAYKSYADVLLTEEGERASKGWSERAREATFSLVIGKRLQRHQTFHRTWTIPISERKLLEVTGIQSQGPTEATAEFTWFWDGSEFGEFSQLLKGPSEMPHRSSARFELYDDGWRLTQIGVVGGL